MLQPSQLEDVSGRYADEIVELRDFLTKSGLAVGTAQVLGTMAERLPWDRAFHRDLTSYIWVVIDSSNGRISYPDLLGVLAVAAAGKRFAAAAGEDAAHNLLRFLMEAKHSLEAKSEEKHGPTARRIAEPIAIRAAEPRLAVVSGTEAHAAAVETPAAEPEVPLRPADREPSDEEAAAGAERRRTPLLWAGAAAALLIILPAGLWMYRHGVSPDANTPASAPSPKTAAVGKAPPAPSEESSPTRRSMALAPTEIPRAVEHAGASRGISPQPTAGSFRVVPQSVAHLPASPTVAPGPGLAPGAATAATGPTAAPIVRAGSVPPAGSAPSSTRAASASAAVKPVPADALSNRLGARNLPAYSAQETDPHAGNPRYPRLLRRSTGTAAGADLVAKAEPPNVPSGGVGAANTASAGIVRPTALGIMAGNLVYSPTPSYPAAASAARVEGEVKVQAEIDRDGNVTSARVVSGPPLLRDAAVDAVQHWRYRPYMAHGKPVPMSATAVVDFELP